MKRLLLDALIWGVMFAAAVVVTLVAAFYTESASGQEWQWTEPADHQRAVVEVEAVDQWTGSGVLVWSDGRRGVVLTTHHNIDGARTLRVNYRNGAVSSVQVLAGDPGSDLAALLVATPPGAVAAPVAPGDPPPEAIVELVGFQAGRHFTASVIGYRQNRTGAIHDLTVDTQIVQGDSGGAVFWRGQVVGVLWGGNDLRHGRYGSVVYPAKATCGLAIRQFLRAAAPYALVRGIDAMRGGCPGGVCPAPPPSRPAAPVTPITPVTPRARHPPQSPREELAVLRSELASMRSQLAAVESMLGEVMDDASRVECGPPGPPGPPGPAGRDGEDGRCVVSSAEIEAAVRETVSTQLRILVEREK